MALFCSFFLAALRAALSFALFQGFTADPVEEFPCDHSLVIAEIAVGVELRSQRILFRILFLIVGKGIFIQFFGRRYAAVIRRIVFRIREIREIRKIREILSAVYAFGGGSDLLKGRQVLGSHVHLQKKLFSGQDLSFQVDGSLSSVIFQQDISLLYVLPCLYQDRIHALGIHQINILGKA